MALTSFTSGTTGLVVLSIVLVVVFILVVYVLYLYKSNNLEKGHSFGSTDSSFLEKQHEYSMLDYPVTIAPKIKTNIIQPPYRTNVKVKLIANCSPSSTKKSIKYTELSEEEMTCDNDEKTKKFTDEISSGELSPNQTIHKSVNTYREKLSNFMSRYRQYPQESDITTERRIWRPEPLVDAGSNLKANIRLPRPDSVLLNEESLGRLTFTMYYSPNEEYLTLLLISGRQINSCDQHYSIRLPAVSIVIENNSNSEVTSNPDEAPNPEYDQEFTFTLRSGDLFDSVLQFTVWDIISNNETRVVGFIRLHLSNYQKLLLSGADTGTICKEIQPVLFPPSVVLGQLLISLLYDCVTDKILVVVRQCKQLAISKEDIDIYLKVSLLLDNDIIVSKRSNNFTATKDLNLSQSFEFLALSDELDKLSTDDCPTLRVADELITNASNNYKKSLIIKDVKSVRNRFASDTLRNHMGILISVRATTGSNKNKRVIGRLYVGKTNFQNNDEGFHWIEMVRNFDSIMTQWHHLRLDKL